MNAARWGLVALSLGLVIGVTMWESRERVSPGPLHPAHASKRELAGVAGCQLCHGRGSSVNAEACEHCHEAIGQQSQQHRGLHGGEAVARIGECGRCHREHHGSELALLDRRSFELAGVAVPERYDHRFVKDFPLAGKHAALRCEQCHKEALAAEPPAGGRYLGLSSNCATCHEDVHKGGYGSDCARCHGQEQAFDRAPGFAHTKAFPLRQAHAGHRCDACHAPGTDRSVAALQQKPLPARNCGDCHANPHGAVAAGTARKAMPLREAADCARCHGATTFREVAITNATHDRFGYAIDAVHGKVGCAQCHGERGERTRWTGAAPKPAQCNSCHENPHGEVATGTARTVMAVRDAADCARCHTGSTFRDVGITNASHAQLGYAIGGVHAKLECAQCHGEHGQRSRWQGKAPQPAQCATCHASPHRQPFTAAVQKPGSGPNDCAGCHIEDHAEFAFGTITATQHAATGFSFTAPHHKLECSQCHGQPGDSYAARFPGRDAADCRACHRDPHNAQFARNQQFQKCADCHLPVQWTPPAFDLEAHSRCRFPLLGQHQAVACRSCHDQVVRGVRTFTGTPQACDRCHLDPHLGRFDHAGVPKQVDGRAGCARCHDEQQFAPVHTFDHDLWTGFKLVQSHGKVACSKCHGRTAVAGGRTTLGKAPGRLCAECHQDVHQGQFRQGGNTDCQRCHEESKFTTTKFDHNRDSRFKLDATHAAVPCARCHTAVASPAGPVTRYRPLGIECKDCHLPARKGSPR
jgi:hypothetical protein